MNQKAIREIENVFHIGLYRVVTLYYKLAVSIIITLFIAMCGLGILSLAPSNTQAHLFSSVAGWFGYVFIFLIVAISIDRGLQLFQIEQIRKRNDIHLRTVMNQHIVNSSRPWMVV